jgi:hypothetical protein
MRSYRWFVAVTFLGLIATACSLDVVGLPSSALSIGQADSGVEDADAASPGESVLDASAGHDASDGGTVEAGDGPADGAEDGGDSGGDSARDSGGDSAGDSGGDSAGDVGSPHAFAFGPATATAQWGDSPGANNDDVACPENEVIIGFAGVIASSGYWVDIEPECGTLGFDAETEIVTVDPDMTLAPQGPPPPPGTMPAEGGCSPNQVVVGFTAEDTPDGHVHQVTLDCVGLTVNPSEGYSVQWASSGPTEVPVGGGPPPNVPESVSPDIRCTSDPAAVANQTNDAFDDLGLVAFGLGCSVLTVK